MDLIRYLRFFVAVAEEGHFGDAAARLEMTQPPVSQGLRRLEKEWGVELIRRTSRGAELTAAGRELLPRARLLIDDAARLNGEARRLAAHDDVLRWGAAPQLGPLAAAACAGRLANSVSSQRLSTAPTIGLISQVESGALDLAVVEHPAVVGNLSAGPIIRLPRAILVPASHAVAHAARPMLRQLDDLVFHHPPRSWNPPGHDQLVDGLRASGLEPGMSALASDDELAAAVASGAGFGLSSAAAPLTGIPGITAVTLAPDVTDLRVRVIRSPGEHDEAAEHLADALWKLGRERRHRA